MQDKELEQMIVDFLDCRQFDADEDLKKYREKQRSVKENKKSRVKPWTFSLASVVVAIAIIFCVALPIINNKKGGEKTLYATAEEVSFVDLDMYENIFPLLNDKPMQINLATFSKEYSQKIVDKKNPSKVLGAYAKLKFTFIDNKNAYLTLYIVNDKYSLQFLNLEVEGSKEWTGNMYVNYLESTFNSVSNYEFSFEYNGYKHYYKLSPQEQCDKETLFNNVFV